MPEQTMIHADIRGAVEKADRKFESTFVRGDAQGMADLYTKNAQLLPTNSGVIEGTQGIRDFWKGVMELGVKEAKLEPVEVEGLEDTAYEVGRYTLKGEGGQVMDQGKYVVIWKREDDRWKLHRDIWNTSMPAQQG